MPKFYLDTEEKGKGYIVGWMGRLQKTRDGQNNRKGGSATPPIEGDDFSFAANGAVVEPSILQVQKPSDRLGDFTVVRASDASYTDSSGVIQIAPDNVARIDYTNGVAELLTEPQSTNLITYSEDLSSLTASNCTVESDVYTSPDGLINMDKVTATGSGSIYSTITVTPNTEYMLSLWADNLSGGTCRVRAFDVTNGVEIFNPFIVADGNRSEYKFTTPLGCVSIYIYPIFSLTVGESIGVWGVQIEPLPYATSYIPTNGSTVTRLQDQITDGANVDVINSEEGTLLFEGSALVNGSDSSNRYLGINDGTTSNRIVLLYSTTNIQFRIVNAGVSVFISLNTIDQISNSKIAIKWASGSADCWMNGVKENTGAITNFSANVFNNINFDEGSFNGAPFSGRTRELKVYDRALTDEELEQITTL